MNAIVGIMYLLIGSGVLTIIIAIIGICASIDNDCKTYNPPAPKPEIKVDVHVDAPTTTPPYPGIAEQFDGRLTNVLKNPLEGIL